MKEFLTEKKRFSIFLVCFLLITQLSGAEKSRYVFKTMGTAAVLSIGLPESESGKYFSMFQEECIKTARLADLYDISSELSRLNRSAAKSPFRCSETLYQLLKESRKAWFLSEGAFDISTKPLMNLWGFYRKRDGKMPSAEEIAKVLQVVGLDKVKFDDKNRTVFFTVPGMSLDLGGIAKGWTVDRTAEQIKPGTHAIINLGGNLRIMNPLRRKSVIGIRHPLDPEKIERKLIIHSGSCSTSGGYERFVVYNSKRYAHIMDPATGYPANQCLAVTVITESALHADWMSTAIFIRGKHSAEKIVKEFPGTVVYLYYPGCESGKIKVEIIRKEKSNDESEKP